MAKFLAAIILQYGFRFQAEPPHLGGLKTFFRQFHDADGEQKICEAALFAGGDGERGIC